MKLVMTLLARDEADVIEAQIAFHLSVGVDFVVAMDNGSRDETADILRAYEREGYLHFTSNPNRNFSQIEEVTAMARRAAIEFGADWVINADADEFWWPREGNLKDVFRCIPVGFGSVRGMWRHFVPRPHDVEFFAERMIVRLCEPEHGGSAFNPHFKTAHRADPHVRVGGGNHEVFGRSARPIRGWYPIDILHFPIRTLEQCQRRYLRQWEFQVRAGQTPAPQPAAAYAAYREGRMREFYEALVVDDTDLEEGLQVGRYAIDTRLRDTLRGLGFPRGITPDITARDGARGGDEGFVREVGLLGEGDEVARLEHRVERRLAKLEHRPWPRLYAAVAARASGGRRHD